MGLKLVKPRSDGGGIPFTNGCRKCDDDMEIIDEVHHVDGSICPVVARNYSFSDRGSFAPLGRYDPRKDRYIE